MIWRIKTWGWSELNSKHSGLFSAGFMEACCGLGMPHGNSDAWCMADSGKWIRSAARSQILGLQSNEDDVRGEGQSRCAHYEGQRYLLCCLANEDPWTWVLGDDPRCTWCAGWCNNVGCSPWVSRRDVDGSRHCRWTEHILPVDPEKAKIGTLLSPYHHELPSWVDVLLQGWQWLGLFEVDVPVVRHAMRLSIDAVMGSSRERDRSGAIRT